MYGKYECVRMKMRIYKSEQVSVCSSMNVLVCSGFVNMTVCEGEGVRVIITMNVTSMSQRSKYDCVNVQEYVNMTMRVCV